MVNLSLIEIRREEKENKEEKNFVLDKPLYFNFMTTPVNISKTSIYDVTDRVYLGRYEFALEYNILFLYDFISDHECRDFLVEYGATLHNESSANISILTYFTSLTVNKWTNVYHRDKIRTSDNYDAQKIMQSIHDLQRMYHVGKLPALVVIKVNDDYNEDICVVSLDGLDKKAIYKTFIDTMDIISKHCEEGFDEIKSRINGERVPSQKKSINKFSTYEFIYDLVKKENKRLKDENYNQEDLASELGFTTKTLLNKRTNNTFDREELLYIAIRFHISLNDLNRLLRANNHLDLGMGGRDGVIRRALLCQKSIIETNYLLMKEHFSPLLYDE